MTRFHRTLVVAALVAFAIPAVADTVVVVQTPPPPVYEQPRWGLGLQLGTPTGFTAKRYLGGRNAFDLYVGGAYGPGLRFGADYLWGLAQLASGSAANLDFYIGAGAFMGVLRGSCSAFANWPGACDGDGYIGGRVPIGLELVFKGAPLSLGLELGPGLAFAPNRAGFILDANLAMRFLL